MSPTPTVRTSPTLAPTATPAPTPTFRPTLPAAPVVSPPAGLRLTTAVEQDDLRVSVTLERNPMPAGQPTWATSRVENLGSTVVSWSHDGCATTVGLGGQMDVEWRPGRAFDDLSRKFLDHLGDYFESVYVQFTPEQFVGMGTYGCADIGLTDLILPGAVLEQRLQWNGQVSPRWGPPPTGFAHLVARSGYFARGELGFGELADGQLESTLDAWVSDGRNPAWLDPPEVVAQMLADPDMRRYLGRLDAGNRGLFNGNEPWLRFNDSIQLWEAGVIEYRDGGGTLHFALIDPWTGTVLSIVDRPWNSKVDGYP